MAALTTITQLGGIGLDLVLNGLLSAPGLLTRPRWFVADASTSESTVVTGGASGDSIDATGKQRFENFYPDVTVEEAHTDEMVTTDNPVEQSAQISDHAYKLPPIVIVDAGWSAAAFQALANPSGYLTEIYGKILLTQERVALCTVFTGKRIYEDMLLKKVDVTTDRRSENVLRMRLTFKKVNFATLVIKDQPKPTAVADPEQAVIDSSTGSAGSLGPQVDLPPSLPEAAASGS